MPRQTRRRVERIRVGNAPQMTPEQIVSIRRASNDSGIAIIDSLIKQFLPRPELLRLRIARAGLKLTVANYVMICLLVGLVVVVTLGACTSQGAREAELVAQAAAEAAQAQEAARIAQERERELAAQQQRQREAAAAEQARLQAQRERQAEAARQRAEAERQQREAAEQRERAAQIAALQVNARNDANATVYLNEAVQAAEELLEALTAEQAKYENTDATGNPVEPLAKDMLAELEARKDELVSRANTAQ